MSAPGVLEPNHRLLVVDDNPAIHEDLRKVLDTGTEGIAELEEEEALLFDKAPAETTYFAIDSAYQGREALEMVRRALAEGRPYALAFVDIRMPPGWDGVETIAHLRQADPELQTVICTAYSDYSWSDIQRRLGHSDSLLILKKPFDNIEVIQLAHALTTKWLASRRAEARMADLDAMVELRTAELNAAAEQYRIIAESASDGILTTGAEGIVRYANPAAARIFGYQPAELTGMPFADLVPGPFPPPPPWAGVEMAGRHRLEAELILEGSFSASLDARQQQVVTVVLRDVTERRRLEKNRAQAYKLESIGRLAAGMAHEINTPIQYTADNLCFLRKSYASLDMLLDGYEKVWKTWKTGQATGAIAAELERMAAAAKIARMRLDIPDAIREAIEGVERVAEIVRAMNSFAHPGGREKAPVDLNHLIRDAVLVSRNRCKDLAEVELDLAPDLPLVVGVAGELSQVFLNLLVNAADAVADANRDRGRARGAIRVVSRLEAGVVEVRVSDTGTGIPEPARPKIFDLFFTTKEVGRGSGQGLAIAHSIVVQKHHGAIEFETETGRGTTFIVRLPVGDAEESSAAGEFPAGPTAVMAAPGGPGNSTGPPHGPGLAELSGKWVAAGLDSREALDGWQGAPIG